MSGPERSTGRFVVDTNVFVAAIKPFTKPGQESRKDTRALSLLVELIVNERVELVGSSRLVDEYRRYAEELESETANLLPTQLTDKMRVVELDERALARCRRYLPADASADVMHASASLQTGAILITNDRDFDRIRRSGLIQVWSIGEAMGRLLQG
ncbi:MAG: PIN domain-containing protein [Nitrososphaerota archaeon]|nr:PIN domain-containing protein [Nitrososphaerota archaeon]